MSEIKRIAILILGWFFVVIGILGLFLPFLQGLLFIMIGLAILSSRSETVKRFLRYLEKRYPQHHERLVAFRKRIKGWFRREDISDL
jgi:uncharacterized membrane protein YbaN (DUF454 family)